MSQKIVVPEKADRLTNYYLRKKGYDVVNFAYPTQDQILENAADAAALMLYVTPITKKLYDNMPNLKIIAQHSVGYDNVDVNYAAERGVWVTNTPGANAQSVAETAVLDMLLMSRQAHLVNAKMMSGHLTSGYQIEAHELAGTTVGIVGFGQIGQAVAKLLQPFGVRVLIYNRTKRFTMDGEFVDWETLFKESDYVSLHLAAVPETHHIVGTQEFKWMKPSATLINLARGSVVDEEALITALQSGEIGYAALDVFEKEPLPVTSPLMKLDNVFLTPHTGANTVEANRRMAMTAAKMIDEALSGKVPDLALNKLPHA